MAKFTVTDKAPADIYGKTVADGDTLSLTKAQAEHHLLKGHIVPAEINGGDAGEASGVDVTEEPLAASEVAVDPAAFAAPIENQAKPARGKRD